MYRIDNSTASTVLPTPKPVGAGGFFTAGTIGGQAATIVEADWLNQVQEELMAILAADGMAPAKGTNNQVITAILDIIAKNTRKRLTGPLTLYVDAASGYDTNNGLTPATAFATIQAAWNYIAESLDCGGYTITISIAHGTYPSLICSGQPLGLGQVQLLGDPVNPTAVVIQSATANVPALEAVGAAAVYLSGLNFSTTGNQFSYAIAAYNGSLAYINGPVNFGACTAPHLVSVNGARIIIDHSYTINGGAPTHYDASGTGSIATLGIPSSNIVVTLSGTPTFSTSFAQADTNGMIEFVVSAMSFVGGAHGPRYAASMGGMIYVAGGGANYFPGDVAGATDATTYGAYQG